jgi:hypothetical protein
MVRYGFARDESVHQDRNQKDNLRIIKYILQDAVIGPTGYAVLYNARLGKKAGLIVNKN